MEIFLNILAVVFLANLLPGIKLNKLISKIFISAFVLNRLWVVLIYLLLALNGHDLQLGMSITLNWNPPYLFSSHF